MYAVLRLYKVMTPSLMMTFKADQEQDAKDYARIMHNADGYEYVVLKQVEG